MKIIITGATGFVGGHLTRYFSALGHEVLAIGRAKNPPKRLLDFAKYQAIDWSEKMPNLEGDAVIHAAALASDSAKYSELYAANVEGTRHLVAATEGVENFIMISSSSVYAYRNNLPKAESDAGKDFDFLTNYGKTKWLSEQVLSAHKNPNQRRLVIRPRAIYGVGDRVILPRLLGMVRGNNFMMIGKMDKQTSQTNVQQISRLIDFFIHDNIIKQQELIVNLADKNPYKMGESIYQLMCLLKEKQLNKKELPIVFLRLIAQTGLSKKITKFLIDAVSYDCVLDLNYLQQFYDIPEDLNLQNESIYLKNWLKTLGSTEGYLKNVEAAPWLL
jgi:2-alkyl-3-oxoalkanoate reductase